LDGPQKICFDEMIETVFFANHFSGKNCFARAIGTGKLRRLSKVCLFAESDFCVTTVSRKSLLEI
jgi:phosphopantetheinyl transferase (holo-ACP synthase)